MMDAPQNEREAAAWAVLDRLAEVGIAGTLPADLGVATAIRHDIAGGIEVRRFTGDEFDKIDEWMLAGHGPMALYAGDVDVPAITG